MARQPGWRSQRASWLLAVALGLAACAPDAPAPLPPSVPLAVDVLSVHPVGDVLDGIERQLTIAGAGRARMLDLTGDLLVYGVNGFGGATAALRRGI